MRFFFARQFASNFLREDSPSGFPSNFLREVLDLQSSLVLKRSI